MIKWFSPSPTHDQLLSRLTGSLYTWLRIINTSWINQFFSSSVSLTFKENLCYVTPQLINLQLLPIIQQIIVKSFNMASRSYGQTTSQPFFLLYLTHLRLNQVELLCFCSCPPPSYLSTQLLHLL